MLKTEMSSYKKILLSLEHVVLLNDVMASTAKKMMHDMNFFVTNHEDYNALVQYHNDISSHLKNCETVLKIPHNKYLNEKGNENA